MVLVHEGTRLTLSPSSRRAWIEIVFELYPTITKGVALLAEGVDRNSAALTRTVTMP